MSKSNLGAKVVTRGNVDLKLIGKNDPLFDFAKDAKSVPAGTFGVVEASSVFQSEHILTMFQSEHIVNMFQPEHYA